MKKLFLLSLVIIIYLSSNAQTDLIKPKSIGIGFFFSDFQTAADIRSRGLTSVLKEHHFLSTDKLNPGISFSYLKGLSTHVDLMGTFGASFAKYQNPNIGLLSENHLLLELNGALNFKLLPDNYALVPFADLGIMASKYLGYYSAYTPVGLGLQLKLYDENFLLLNAQYRIPVTSSGNYHFYYGLTAIGQLSPNKPKEVPAPVVLLPVVTDRDNDGVPDSVDLCPDVPGLASLHGCPDRDGDGIADKDDKCPDVPGLAKYQGCPIPDTDGDGINDELDKCPTVPGVARYQGCPIPDTDGDGVNDEEDKCPNEAGPVSNHGCPVIDEVVIAKVNEAAKNIYFATGSAKLLAKSFPSLNNVVKVLQDNPSYMVDISGHTDITGTHDKNVVLSDNRAASVKNYLVSKGVNESKISSKGFGPDKPIADNKTKAGRSKNRRVEMTLRNY
ncbi:MAG: hypothetical protein NVSMB45_13490 [Ginsengibacter sp.]